MTTKRSAVLAACAVIAAVAATSAQAQSPIANPAPGPIEGPPPRVPSDILVYDEWHSFDQHQIHTILDTGFGATQVAATTYSESEPVWSPDGRKIAFTRISSIWVMDRNGANVTRVASGIHPSWSPDGKHIAFNGVFGERHGEIYTIEPDGSNEVQLTHSKESDWDPTWSPDSQQIAWEQSEGLEDGLPVSIVPIFVMNADGTGQRQLTHYRSLHARSPDWSPDGQRIAFATENVSSKRVGIATVRASDGADPVQVTNGYDYTPAWSPNGQKIAFARGPWPMAEILTIPAMGGPTFNVTALRPAAFHPDWIKGGERIGVNR